jgi:hypothetical protein
MRATVRLTLRLAAGNAILAAVVLAVVYWPQVRNETFILLGNRDEPGGWYGLWSGFAGGLRVFEWPLIAALLWWHHQCAVDGCWWYARRTTAAGERACWRHHPEPHRTARDLHHAHHAAKTRHHLAQGEPP